MSKKNDAVLQGTPELEEPMKNPENREVAGQIVSQVRGQSSGTLGVLLTLAEVALGDSPALKSYKDSIKREMHKMIDQNQDVIYYELGIQSHRFSPGNIYYTTERELN